MYTQKIVYQMNGEIPLKFQYLRNVTEKTLRTIDELVILTPVIRHPLTFLI